MLKSKDGFNRILYQLKNKIIDFYLSKDFLFEKNEELNKTFYESNNSLSLFISNKTALEARSSLLNSIGECLKIYKSLGIYLNVFKSSDENTYFCMFLYKETMYLAFKGTIDSQNNMRGTYYFDVLDGLINLYMDNKIFSSSLTYYSFILITLNHLNPNVIHFKKEVVSVLSNKYKIFLANEEVTPKEQYLSFDEQVANFSLLINEKLAEKNKIKLTFKYDDTYLESNLDNFDDCFSELNRKVNNIIYKLTLKESLMFFKNNLQEKNELTEDDLIPLDQEYDHLYKTISYKKFINIK